MAIAKHILFAALGGVLIIGQALAATQSVTASASFDDPLTVTKDADISFGILKAATSGTYVITPSGSLTASNGGVAIGGAPTYGKITISGSATQTISVRTGSYVANSGVVPSAATCVYSGVAITNCDAGASSLTAPGSGGKVLTLGLTIAADGTQTAGSTATPSFVVTVLYH